MVIAKTTVYSSFLNRFSSLSLMVILTVKAVLTFSANSKITAGNLHMLYEEIFMVFSTISTNNVLLQQRLPLGGAENLFSSLFYGPHGQPKMGMIMLLFKEFARRHKARFTVPGLIVF